ncbi:hypothetical protein NDU88_007281 [Pleurodeles waltl]|uniref:Uncharacterized protein n=1 Tax=Pleurodeles waltl TaxID=8319 RepID=A0AAV7UNX4_PLEWA|nr:hypothetical protein NDU88_007281 [Pleurodeles waltl]
MSTPLQAQRHACLTQPPPRRRPDTAAPRPARWAPELRRHCHGTEGLGPTPSDDCEDVDCGLYHAKERWCGSHMRR